MSIIETKLFKERIETPDLSSNTLYSKDIIGDDVSYIGYYSTLRDGLISVGGGKCDAICLQFSKEHFITGRIGKIQFPYYGGKDKQAYLAVQLYYEGDDQTVTKTFQETVFSKQKCKEQNGDEGISEVFFDNLVLPKDYKFVRFIFSQNNTEAPNIYTGTNCKSLRVRIVSDSSGYNWDDDDCKIFTGVNFTQNWYGYVNVIRLFSVIDEISEHKNNSLIHVTAEDKEKWNNSTVELNAGSCIEIGENNTISVRTADSLSYDDTTVPTTKSMYLEMGYVLTDAQMYADEAVTGHRNQTGLHTSTLLQNKWNGHVDDDTIHVTADEKIEISKITPLKTSVDSHIGDATHLTETQKTAIGKVDTLETNVSSHIGDKNIHFEKSLIIDGVQGGREEHVYDLSQGVSEISAAQGIAYVQICSDHTLQQGSLLKTISVPQNHDRTDYTNAEVFLVIFGDTTGNDDWELVTMSQNTCLQIAGGEDMVFDFGSNRCDLGLYKKYRLFYVTSNDTPPTLPVTGNDYTGVKMAFPARRIDDNCMAMQSNGTWVSRYTFPAIITYETEAQEAVLHKDNENRHIDPQFKSDIINAISSVSDLTSVVETHINDADIHITMEEKDTLSRLAKEDLISEVENKIDLVRTTLDEHIGDFEEHVYKYGLHLSETEKNDKKFLSHIGDDTIHVTSEDKTRWNEHVNDTDIHITIEEKDTLARLAKEDLISEVEDKIDLVRTTLDEHIGDFEEHVYKYGLHLSDVEKNFSRVDTKVNEEVTNLQTKVNEAIDTLSLFTKFGQFERFSSLDNPNYGVQDGGKTNATAFDLSREHFTTGDIKTVEVHHIDGDDVKNIILCAVVFKKGETNDTPKTLDDCIYSTNTQNQIDGDYSGKLIFQFDNLILPDDYEFVRFFFAKNKTTFPANNNTDTVHSVRVQVLRNLNADSWNEYDDDECKIYTTSGSANWYIAISCSRIYYPYSDIKTIFERIASLETRVNELENL